MDRLPERVRSSLTWRLFAWRQRRQERADVAFDDRHGTDTAGDLALTTLDLTSTAAERGNNVYRPVWAPLFRTTIAQLPIDYREFSLIDFGAGKGKLMLLASSFAFHEIVGIEYSAILHAIAVQNVERYSAREQQCHNIRPMFGDALEFVLPAGPVICTFFNPFDATTFDAVVGRLETSFVAEPRPIYIVFLQVRSLRERPDVTARLARSSLFSKVSRTTNAVVYRALPPSDREGVA